MLAVNTLMRQMKLYFSAEDLLHVYTVVRSKRELHTPLLKGNHFGLSTFQFAFLILDVFLSFCFVEPLKSCGHVKLYVGAVIRAKTDQEEGG